VIKSKNTFLFDFSTFLNLHGILCQSSCSHTLQQNDIVERKNRHLVVLDYHCFWIVIYIGKTVTGWFWLWWLFGYDKCICSV